MEVPNPPSHHWQLLQTDDLQFLKSQTGIEDDILLKEHVLEVQKKAYNIWPYPCIERLAFARLKISRLPAYNRVLALGREREGAILLDVGCCFGNDVRKVIADGYPVHNVIASDLRPEFWDLGHDLFKTTHENFPVTFIAGDAFDPSHLQIAPPFYEQPTSDAPELSSLKSLTPLHSHVSVIHTSSLFHLFNEDKQLQLARALASLMSPSPGSLIFGLQVGLPDKGLKTTSFPGMVCHSPKSWREMWDGQVFRNGTVHVEAKLVNIERNVPSNDHIDLLVWSVVRL